MDPSFQKGHEIGYDLKKEFPVIHYNQLVDVIQRSLEAGGHYVMLTLGVYVGYTSAGGIVMFGEMAP